MDTDQIILSPARRARRCILNLFFLLIIVVGAYIGLRPDQSAIEKGGKVVASSDTGIAPIAFSASMRQAVVKDAPPQLSLKSSVESAFLIATSDH